MDWGEKKQPALSPASAGCSKAQSPRPAGRLTTRGLPYIESTILRNALPLHPFKPGEPESNRAPTDGWRLAASRSFCSGRWGLCQQTRSDTRRMAGATAFSATLAALVGEPPVVTALTGAFFMVAMAVRTCAKFAPCFAALDLRPAGIEVEHRFRDARNKRESPAPSLLRSNLLDCCHSIL